MAADEAVVRVAADGPNAGESADTSPDASAGETDAMRVRAPEATLLSFVIPQKGRLDLLEETLRAIALQEAPPTEAGRATGLEVILITQDEPPDAVRALMEDVLGGVPRLSYECVPMAGASTISALRNHGARLAGGELLAFLDADIALSPDWTRAMTGELCEHEGRVVVSAVQAASDEPTDIERLQVELARTRLDSEVDFLSGHNLLTSRRTFEAIGGFPEHLLTCEDYVFTDRAARLGTLFRSSRASYVHLGEDRDHATVFRKERWRGRSNLASLDGRRPRAVELPSFIIPPAVALAFGAVPVALLAGRPVLAAGAALVGAIPVLIYSARLLMASRGRLELPTVLGYYLAYFPARGIGMLQGLLDVIGGGGRR